MTPLRRAIPDRRVRREVRWAAIELALAARRAQSVGAANAPSDRRVRKRMRRASSHASRAVAYTVSPPPRHRLQNTLFFIAGAVTAGLVVSWARRGRSLYG